MVNSCFRRCFEFSFKFLVIVIFLFSCQPNQKTLKLNKSADTLSFMSFNILYGGDEVDFSKVVEAIQLANPDVIGIQEAEGATEKLTKALNYPYYDSKLHLISKYPLIRSFDKGWYFTYVETKPGKVFVFSNIHLPSDPYGPELVRDGKPIDSVYKNEYLTRFHELDTHKKYFSELQSKGFPIILTGDFNAPSHLDWTSYHTSSRPHMKYAVEWPVSKSLEKMGFIDTYRSVFPDAKAKPGLTWTPGSPAPKTNPNETHDRIDFIWASGTNNVLDAKILGEKNGPDVDISVTPYPSDHRGVITTCVINAVNCPNYIQTKNRILNFSDSIKLKYFTQEKGPFQIILKDSSGNSIMTLNNIKSSNGELYVKLANKFTKKIDIYLLQKDSVIAQGNFWRLEKDKFQPKLLLTKEVYLENEPIPVTWQNSPGDRFDWIAIYSKSANTKADYGLTHQQSKYLIYKYTMGEVSGNLILDSFSKGDFWPLKPGEYVIHLLSDDGFQSLASKSIKVIKNNKVIK